MAKDLFPTEQEAVHVLLQDWQDIWRCTTIDQALERVGVPFSHERRLVIAASLLESAEIQEAMRWHPATYILTNDEKLMARALLRHEQHSQPLPAAADIAQALSLAEEKVQEGLTTLAWVGFLKAEGGAVQLAPDYRSFLSGLGFYYHEVVLESGERFNTNCAPDFFFLVHRPTRQRLLVALREGTLLEVSSQLGMSAKMVAAVQRAAQAQTWPQTMYEDQRATLNDACGFSAERIRIVVERGQLRELSPENTWYLRGGG
jgi:hypothetical protein